LKGKGGASGLDACTGNAKRAFGQIARRLGECPAAVIPEVRENSRCSMACARISLGKSIQIL
jgi:hypothetical protein